MQFDRTTIIAAMKMSMTTAEKAKTQDHNLAIALCLDDISTHLQSRAFLLSYDVTIAAATRTKEVTGENYDLRTIFAIKYGTGNEQKILEYVGPKVFLKKYDNPNADAQTPSYFTILNSSDGNPIVKFDRPAPEATTMTVYYFTEITENNMFMARSVTAITAGSLAWFYGIESETGAAYYGRFRAMLQAMMTADTFLPKEVNKFVQSKEDEDIRITMRRITNRR